MRWVALALVAGVVSGVGCQLPPPAGAATTTTARQLAAVLAVRTESGAGYTRTAFKLWIDADHDCQNTRAEVLIAESRVRPTFTSATRPCTVATGRWVSSYDGRTWTRASDVDVDHVVPLKEAWDSGARSWTATNRQRYANDLGHPWTLEAVTDNVNQSKGDRDIAEWQPPLASARCGYAVKWATVKYRWRLTVDSRERTALLGVLGGACGAQRVAIPARAI